MEVAETQLEVDHVAESVGLPLEGFDFVVDAFDHVIGDEVLEIDEKARFRGARVLATLANSWIPVPAKLVRWEARGHEEAGRHLHAQNSRTMTVEWRA